MSAPYTILLSWPSLCQKLSKLVDTRRSSGENNFDCFLRHGVYSRPIRCSAVKAAIIDCVVQVT